MTEVEGNVESLSLVGKAFALPCGCLQKNAEIDPEAVERILVTTQHVIEGEG